MVFIIQSSGYIPASTSSFVLLAQSMSTAYIPEMAAKVLYRHGNISGFIRETFAPINSLVSFAGKGDLKRKNYQPFLIRNVSVVTDSDEECWLGRE
jgi:hypothetical protein